MPVLPNKLVEFVQAKYGLTPDELHKLFESVGRVNQEIKVVRRRSVAGKEYSKVVGKPMEINEAIQYEKTRNENRHVKEEKIRGLIDEPEFNELIVRPEVNDAIYPQRLAPLDIVRYVDSAGEKLAALDRERAKPPKIYSVREETLLDVITLVKKQEPIRLARYIAEKQRAYIVENPLDVLEAEFAEWMRKLKGEPPPETEEEKMARLVREEEQRLEEERIAAEEAARNFDDLPDVRTLLDDVAELILTNPDAAAAIVRQWIGNSVLIEKS